MPKESNETDIQDVEELEVHKKKKRKWIFILVLVFVGLLLFLTMYFDIAHIRSKHLSKMLQKVPIVKNIVSSSNVEDSPSEESLEMEQLKQQLEEVQNQYKNLLQQKEEQDIALERLKEIEEQQLEFQQRKKEFEELIINQKTFDAEAYEKFYRTLDPETAENIYRVAIDQMQLNKEIKKYVETYEEMDESAVAAIFEEMSTTDMELVVLILQNIEVEQRARILGEMDPKIAATITKQMAPMAS